MFTHKKLVYVVGEEPRPDPDLLQMLAGGVGPKLETYLQDRFDTAVSMGTDPLAEYFLRTLRHAARERYLLPWLVERKGLQEIHEWQEPVQAALTKFEKFWHQRLLDAWNKLLGENSTQAFLQTKKFIWQQFASRWRLTQDWAETFRLLEWLATCPVPFPEEEKILEEVLGAEIAQASAEWLLGNLTVLLSLPKPTTDIGGLMVLQWKKVEENSIMASLENRALCFKENDLRMKGNPRYQATSAMGPAIQAGLSRKGLKVKSMWFFGNEALIKVNLVAEKGSQRSAKLLLQAVLKHVRSLRHLNSDFRRMTIGVVVELKRKQGSQEIFRETCLLKGS